MESTTTKRTRNPNTKYHRLEKALQHPAAIQRELNNRSFYEFFKYFWKEVSNDELILNWHIEYVCNEVQKVAEKVAIGLPKEYDLIINIPPGTTKTKMCSIMLPVWCWTKWYWMQFITGSYTDRLALENAVASRDLVRSDAFRKVYPELEIKEDADQKSNFKVQKVVGMLSSGHLKKVKLGGNRLSTSVGGSITGFHGHILIVDDPLNPKQAASPVELANVNHWMSQTLSTRKVDKEITPTILIMQRLHQSDPSGVLLDKKDKKIKHICLPGEIRLYKDMVRPVELIENYVNDLLDSKRLNWEILKEMEADLGQYGYAGQIGQKPTPAGGGMFQIDNFSIMEKMPMEVNIMNIVRYWDKAGSQGQGAYTVGVKMAKTKGGRFIVMDVKRGQWGANVREAIIRTTAETDGTRVPVYFEQEPGSGGKESAEATTRNLAGFSAHADLPRGDKVYRADPYSVQVNNGNVALLRADWNRVFIDEHEYFPNSTYKDQVDAGSGAFTKLVGKREVQSLRIR